jgi:hypothetical protein
MPNATDYVESGVINHFFRSSTFPKPTVIAIALTTNVPADNVTQATLQELPNANNYARANLGAPADATWTAVTQSVAGSGLSSNTGAINFNQCTGADWGWVSGVVILDNAGYGSGAPLYASAITPQLIQVGTTFSFPIGNIVLGAN